MILKEVKCLMKKHFFGTKISDYDKNFDILGASTGFFAVLLALKENPGSKIVLCGIGIDTGGGTFYKKNYSKFLLRRNVDKKLFIFLKKKYKKNLLTTDNKISLKHGIKLFKAKL